MNARSAYDGGTPLQEAAGMGHPDVVKCLVSNGADVNARDKDGKTPLMRATEHGVRDVDMVEFLRQHGGAKE